MIRPGPNNFLNNRQLLEKVEQWAFQLLNKVLRMHKIIICLKFVPCDMSLWPKGGSTVTNSASPDNDSLITFKVLEPNSELLHAITLLAIMYMVHPGHIHVSFGFYQRF